MSIQDDNMDVQSVVSNTAKGSMASMLYGIIGLVLFFIPFVPIVLGIISIVFYLKANRKIIESGDKLQGKGMATAGLILGIVDLVVGLTTLLFLIFLISFGSALTARFVAEGTKPPEIIEALEKMDEAKHPLPLNIWLLTKGEGKITARLADKDEPHICQLANVYLAYNPKYKELQIELFNRRIQIKDIFQGVLMNKNSSDLSSGEEKQELVKRLVDKINAILTEGQIETIYMEIMVQ